MYYDIMNICCICERDCRNRNTNGIMSMIELIRYCFAYIEDVKGPLVSCYMVHVYISESTYGFSSINHCS
jgi:hypothetical protein